MDPSYVGTLQILFNKGTSGRMNPPQVFDQPSCRSPAGQMSYSEMVKKSFIAAHQQIPQAMHTSNEGRLCSQRVGPQQEDGPLRLPEWICKAGGVGIFSQIR